MKVDHSRIAEARETITNAEELIEKTCPTCGGMGSGIEGTREYCEECKGAAFIQEERWVFDSLLAIDYWQARTLVAEVALQAPVAELADWLEEQGHTDAAGALRREFGAKEQP